MSTLSENTRQQYLQLMGIDVWLPAPPCKIEPAPCAANDLTRLQQKAKNCQACALHQSRKHVVFGVGNPHADIMFIGEAPGFHEDQQGEPFVGRAGLLLNAMLKSIGLMRDDIYIANVLKCRPPQNRDPHADEVSACSQFLQQQIALIQPKLLVAVGRIAANYLLNNKTSLGRLRQTIHTYSEHHIPLLVTYHPAYLLRSPADKAKAWQDLCRIKQQLQ